MRNQIFKFARSLGLASLVLPVLLIRMTVTTEHIQTNRSFWHPANGPYGGYVIRLTIHPINGHIYAGLGGGGVFRSSDNAANWIPQNEALANKEVRAFVIKSNGEVLAGTAAGVFRVTVDGSWIPVHCGLTNTDVRTLVINSFNQDIFAGTADGIFRFANNASCWDTINTNTCLPTKAARDIRALVFKVNGDMIAGTADGVFRFNGVCWVPVNNGFVNKDVRVLAINRNNEELFAGTTDGVFCLKDNSAVWDSCNTGLTSKAARNIRALAIKTNGDVFAGTGAGVFLKRINSVTWQKVTDLPDNDVYSLAITATGDIIFAGTLSGVFRSFNSGSSWEEANNGMTGFDVSAIAVNPQGEVFAGTRAVSGCGTIGASVFRLSDGRGQWKNLKNGLPGHDIQTVAIKKSNGSIFVGTFKGVHRSDDKGASWEPDSIGLGYLLGNPPSLNRNVGTIVIKDNGDALAGTQGGGVFLKLNTAVRWDSINAGLTSRLSRYVFDLAIYNGDVYVSTWEGVFRLGQNSNTWENKGNALPDSVVHASLSLVINSQGHLFSGGYYILSPNKIVNGIVRSTNNGARWDSVDIGLPNKRINALAISKEDVIFAATAGGGVFSSNDNGNTWHEYNAGLANLNVLSLAIDEREDIDDILYAGTAAGGIFWSEVSVTSRTIRVGNASAAPGSMVCVPLEFVAQGDENALGFSVNFDPTILSNPQARLGKDASSASLIENRSQIGSGRYGIVLALPVGQTFAAGNREIVIVCFTVNANTAASSTRIEFGDQPIVREVVDIKGKVLTAAWSGGTVNISHGFEADVAPRPNGNGSVTIADWVQIGRFVAGLDTLRTDVNEFQRADCAPKPCGDGRLSIADWVQAGRYGAGLDPIVAACGPKGPTSAITFAPNALMKANADRAVHLLNPKFQPGQMHTATIELDSQGNENAIGLCVGFDPAILTFKNATLGRDASGATLIPNGRDSTNGRVGLALALPAGQSFAAGVRQLVLVNFSINPNTSATSTPIEFKDQPIAREVVDVNGNVLQSSWSVVTSVQERVNELPTTFNLSANHPNPFNPSTTITYALPQAAEVELMIFDVMGRRVRTLVRQHQQAGRYAITWDGRNEQGEVIASGVYLYQLRAGSFVQTRRMALAR